MFVTPGTCCTSMILWARTLSCHLSCIDDSLLFIRKSQSAWQSVLIMTGYPYMMSENLSKENFSAMNSSKNGLYFSSDTDCYIPYFLFPCSHSIFFPHSTPLSVSKVFAFPFHFPFLLTFCSISISVLPYFLFQTPLCACPLVFLSILLFCLHFYHQMPQY